MKCFDPCLVLKRIHISTEVKLILVRFVYIYKSKQENGFNCYSLYFLLTSNMHCVPIIHGKKSQELALPCTGLEEICGK